MLKKLPLLAGCFIAMLSAQRITAQEYQSIPISTGFNADVIANGTGPAMTTTSTDLDGASFCFVATDYKLNASSTPISYGIPTSGFITSAVAGTPGLTYQLAPLSGNNSLRLQNAAASGTLTFTTPTAAVSLYMLATSGSAAATLNLLVNFTDGTSQPFTSISVSDWYGGANAAISGIGRVGRGSDILEPNSTNPRIYQINLPINAGNQSKPIASVQVTKPGADGVANIFAFSADAYTSCPAPTNITYVSTISNATLNWTAPSPAPSNGYEYYFSASSTAPTPTTTPTGSVPTGTSVTLSGVPGSTYYFWVRSNCGATKGIWKASSFIIGQVSYTYTGGEIGTQHNTAPTLTTTNPAACVGNFPVSVPPGYKIASVATTYSMTAASGAYMSEQRSLLVCTTNNTTEAAISSGVNMGGTYNYSRSNLNIANNLTGTVNFQLRAWRTWTGSGQPEDCGTNYNKVDSNTWKLIVTYALDACTTPAAPTAANQNVCPTATYGDLSVNGIVGAVYKWYTAATGGTELTATTVTTPGTYYVSQVVGTCESPRSAGVIITQNPTPLPTAAPQTLCGGTTVANLTTTTGTNIKWYAALTGGTALAPSTLLATGNYYVSQTVNGCESARATIAITINTTPVPVASEQIFCAGATPTIGDLVITGVTGGTFKWYATETSTAVLPLTTSVGTGIYYVTQTLGTCESYRTAVQVVVATVVAPTIFAQEVCTGATIANLQVSGSPIATFNWYASANSTTPLASTTLLTPGTYYVSQTIGTCEGPKASVAVTINTITAPVVEDQQFCTGATAANLTGTPATGATLRWYADATTTTQLTNTSLLATGTYYVSQKLNNCESDRTAVEVTVSNVIPAPDAQNQSFCIGSSFDDLVVSGEEGAVYKWYSSNTTQTEILSTSIVSEGTYYVSQTVDICESSRTAVTVSYNVIPAPTTTSLAICGGLTYAELDVEGTEGAVFTWYNSATAETALENDGAVVAGTAYVSQTIDGCESSRVAVAITLTTTPAPAPTALQAFCGDAFVSDLTAGGTTGYTVNWYGPEGNLLTGDEALVTGAYSVSQTADGCESIKMVIAVTVTEQLDMPAGETAQDFDAGATVSQLVFEAEEGAILKFFLKDGDDWIAIPAATPMVDGNTYGISQGVGNNCESEKLEITASVILSSGEFALTNTVVYPNPAVDVLTVESRETLSQVTVINLLGQEVLRKGAAANNVQVNISELPQATYILQVKAASGASASFKIVKQ